MLGSNLQEKMALIKDMYDKYFCFKEKKVKKKVYIIYYI
jgi:hypothetical protein